MLVLKRNAFVLGLVLAVALAWLTPDWGARGGVLQSQFWTRVGVVLVFLVQGFGLSTASIASGVTNGRLHLFTQGWIFLGAPLLALIGLGLVGNRLEAELHTALFFLAVLPTTVFSAVALIGQADGNVAAGVFNTVLSNLLGVIIVPAAVIWHASASETAPSLSLGPALRGTLTMLLLPFVIGHVLQRPLRRWAPTIKAVSRPLSQCIICLMVYAAFATSFRDAVWQDVGFSFAWHGLLATCALLGALSLGVWVSGRFVLASAEDRIAAFYCGSQKSLAVGVPYAVAIFTAGNGELDSGAVLLPLLFYHPLQLFLGVGLIGLRRQLFR